MNVLDFIFILELSLASDKETAVYFYHQLIIWNNKTSLDEFQEIYLNVLTRYGFGFVWYR